MKSQTPNSGNGGGYQEGWEVMNFTPTFSNQFAVAFRLLPEGAKSIIALGKMALEYFLSTYALPLEIYLRWRWGTRGLTLFQVWFLVSSALTLLSLCSSPSLGMLAGGLGLLVLYFVGAAGLAVWHFYEARRDEARHKGPRRRYSYAFGEPLTILAFARFLGRAGYWPRWLWNDSIISRLLEPAIGLVSGVILISFSVTRPLGILLLASGAGLLLKRHLLHLRAVKVRRDRWDAITISENWSADAEEERRGFNTQPAFEVRLAPALLGRPQSALDGEPEPIPRMWELVGGEESPSSPGRDGHEDQPGLSPSEGPANTEAREAPVNEMSLGAGAATKPVRKALVFENPVEAAAFQALTETPSSQPTVTKAVRKLPLARVVGGPDETGRSKVQCPDCHRRFWCKAEHRRRPLKCPGCGAGFVFDLQVGPVDSPSKSAGSTKVGARATDHGTS